MKIILVILSLASLNLSYSQVRKIFLDSSENNLLINEYAKKEFDIKKDTAYLLYLSLNDCFRCTSGKSFINSNVKLRNQTLLVVDYVSDAKLKKFIRQYKLEGFKLSKNRELKKICRKFMANKIQNTSFYAQLFNKNFNIKPLIQLHNKQVSFTNELINKSSQIHKFKDTIFYQNILDMAFNKNDIFTIIEPDASLLRYNSKADFKNSYLANKKITKLAYASVINDMNLPDSLKKVNTYDKASIAYNSYIKPMGLQPVKFEKILSVTENTIRTLAYFAFSIHTKNTLDFSFEGRYFIVDILLNKNNEMKLYLVKYSKNKNRYFIPSFGFDENKNELNIFDFPKKLNSSNGQFYFSSKYIQKLNDFEFDKIDSSFSLEKKNFYHKYNKEMFMSKFKYKSLNNNCKYFERKPIIVCKNSTTNIYLEKSDIKNLKIYFMEEISNKLYLILRINKEKYIGILDNLNHEKIELFPISTKGYYFNEIYSKDANIIFNLKNIDDEDFIFKISKENIINTFK